ncbi:MAG: ComEC/Rec2 family competence protein [Pyrinomonadaceae bacterium]|nr:ComEC/Rec2 family competence protein [Pyrinomonadaceae bacterium]
MSKFISSAKFSHFPFMWMSLSFGCGIFISKHISIDWRVWLTISLISAAFSFVNSKFSARNWLILLAFLFLGGFYLQVDQTQISPNRIKRIYDERRIISNEPIEFEGILHDSPEIGFEGFSLVLSGEKIYFKGEELAVSGKVKLFASTSEAENKAEYEKLNLQYGSKIRVACRLQREESYLNPGGFSRLEMLDQQNVDATGVIKSPFLVEKLGDKETFPLLGWIYEQRQNLIIGFRDNFNSKTAGIMIASLLGNKNFLDQGTAEIFREGGTFHVLVISGLHITFIGGLILLLLRFFTNQKFWQFIFAVVFLWSYSLAVGAEVPVVRASIMFTILLFSQVIYRNGSLLNSFGLCILTLLVWRPADLFTSSFQLTFASVAAIIVFAFPLIENLRKIGSWTPTAENPFPPDVSVFVKRFCEMLYWREEVWERESKQRIWSAKIFKTPYLPKLGKNIWQSVSAYLFEGVLVSLIVQVSLLPFLVIYFHRVSFSSIWLNLWVGFFITLESFSAVIALLFAEFSQTLALPLIKLTEIFNYLLLAVPNIFVENDLASMRVPIYSGAMRSIYYVYFIPLIFLGVSLDRWKPFEVDPDDKLKTVKFYKSAIFSSAILLITCLSLVVFHPFSAPRENGRLKIDFLDVGQGDSALVTFPNGETMLVDGGGKINFKKNYAKSEDSEEVEIFEPDTQTIGESVVSEFLWEKGYSKIDYILATHADTDHIQGLIDVAENFKVKAAFFGRTPAKDEDFIELSNILRKKKIPEIILSRGDIMEFEKVFVEVLYPEKDTSDFAVSDNDHSLVLRITFGTKKFLFTGDIEKGAEAFLVKNPSYLQADVVKAAHHGSRTSSTQTFVEATRAEYVIIPVGKRSQFGHPHKEVVARWKNSGAKVYTTGERGTVTISTNGKDLEVQTFLKE